MLTSCVSEAVNNHIGKFRRYMQIWHCNELQLPSTVIDSDPEKNRKGKCLHQPEKTASVVCVPSVVHIHIAVQNKRYTKHKTEEVKHIHDC